MSGPTDEPTPPVDAVTRLLAEALRQLAERPVTPEALTPEAAAAYLSVSRSKLHDMNVAGLVPAPVELGDRCPRYLRSELAAWLRSGCPTRVTWRQIRDQAMKRAS